MEQQATEGLEEVEYRGVIKLLQGYTPPSSCKSHMLKDLPSILKIKEMESITDECTMVAESRLQHLPDGVPRLDTDKALAIAAYTYDLGFANVEENLYFMLNKVLRERNPQKMKQLQPFLWYLMAGLSDLPAVKAAVFRGVSLKEMETIKRLYRQGVDVHWSSFTSTTTNLKKAQAFAQPKGIGKNLFLLY